MPSAPPSGARPQPPAKPTAVRAPGESILDTLPSWALVLIAAVAGVAYAADMIVAGRAGRYPVDLTWGLDHWPMQASLGLCIPAVAAVAALRLPCGQVAAWTAAIAAMWLGVLSVLYPQHAGSLGQTVGIACATWGLLLVVESFLTSSRRRQRRQSRS